MAQRSGLGKKVKGVKYGVVLFRTASKRFHGSVLLVELLSLEFEFILNLKAV